VQLAIPYNTTSLWATCPFRKKLPEPSTAHLCNSLYGTRQILANLDIGFIVEEEHEPELPTVSGGLVYQSLPINGQKLVVRHNRELYLWLVHHNMHVLYFVSSHRALKLKVWGVNSQLYMKNVDTCSQMIIKKLLLVLEIPLQRLFICIIIILCNKKQLHVVNCKTLTSVSFNFAFFKGWYFHCHLICNSAFRLTKQYRCLK
jgi:hypothetical protein